MLDAVINIVLLLYGLAVLFVLLHSLFDAHLIFHYLRSYRKKKAVVDQPDYFPLVTIQLPVYNELHVVERLLDAVAAIEYPAHKLDIQVLDDSTDETADLIAQKVSLLQKQHVSIVHIQRNTREGFKAGALKHGLSIARGEYLAVFDADFIPSKDFLQKTIPFFVNPTIGMVQTKWGHINKESSWLAKLQAMALDGHFSIEQRGRNAAGYFINFNGTAGVWRKQTILDAGNWQADTLTEDFDLSFRAQLKGWQFKYLEDVTTPAELPPLISALKSQQFRWTKGGAETAKKNLRKLLQSDSSLSIKLHGTLHLLYSLGFVSIITCAILTVPLMFVRHYHPEYAFVFKLSRIVGISSFIYLFHYFISYYKNATGSIGQRVVGFLFSFPLFGALFIGISFSNAVGIAQGYMGIKSGFVRTPKFNSVYKGDSLLKSKYAQTKINWVTMAEGLLIFYFLFGLIQAFYFKNWGIMPFLFMALAGFSIVFGWSIQERVNKKLLAVHG